MSLKKYVYVHVKLSRRKVLRNSSEEKKNISNGPCNGL